MPTRQKLGATIGSVALVIAVLGYLSVGPFAQGVIFAAILVLPLSLAAYWLGARRLAMLAALTVIAEVLVLLCWSVAPALRGEIPLLASAGLVVIAAAVSLKSYLAARSAT